VNERAEYGLTATAFSGEVRRRQIRAARCTRLKPPPSASRSNWG
jgi:hypothetical protein